MTNTQNSEFAGIVIGELYFRINEEPTAAL